MALQLRMIIMLCACFIASIFFATLIGDNGNFAAEIGFVAYLLSAYFILAILSLMFCMALVRSYGLGKETKNKIFWRHTLTILIYSICNIYVIICIFLPRTDDPQSAEEVSDWYIKMF